jgi:hypothetical protein
MPSFKVRRQGGARLAAKEMRPQTLRLYGSPLPSPLFDSSMPLHHCRRLPDAGHQRAQPLSAQPPLPSLAQGVLVRFKFEGQYHLQRVDHMAADADGRTGLALYCFTDPGSSPGLRLIPLAAASNTNPLHDQLWLAAGVHEVARLQACVAHRRQVLPLAEVRRGRARRCVLLLKVWSLQCCSGA